MFIRFDSDTEQEHRFLTSLVLYITEKRYTLKHIVEIL